MVIAIELNVLTFNIRHAKGTDNRLDLHRIAHVIKESKADVVGLNEVDNHFSARSDYVDQTNWLANELKMDYVFGPAISLTKKSGRKLQYGNALLSKYPITRSTNHKINLLAPICEPRAILEANINVLNTEIKVLTSHFSLHPILHKKQVGQLLKCLTDSLPSIIMGDFNKRPTARSIKKITTLLKETCANKTEKERATFPSQRPKIKLDYIFTSQHFTTINTEIITSSPKASDHLPVLARVKLLNL